MIIYSHSITPRLQYVIDFISAYYNHAFILTVNREKYLASESTKINYSHESLSEGEIYIHPHSLLFETSIRPIQSECSVHNNIVFFKTEGSLGFDLFAAIFFLLSRYEEYLPNEKDMYGRYDYKNSLAYKGGFLHQPLINIWLEDFRNVLKQKKASFPTHQSSFTCIPTYDIDIAWSYLNKGKKRTIGGFFRDALKGQWWYVKKRWQVLRKKEQDPFDTYEWLNELHKEKGLRPVYFFPLADKVAKYDKNTAPQNKNYQNLIRQHAAKYKIGLHPSWQSGDKPDLLRKELNAINNITQQTITLSRQHFIRFTLPGTYRRLIDLGIKEEYSMGYGSSNGFRASIASPFYWYDLEREEKTSLLIHPFCYMDANAFFEQKLSPQAALEEAMHYYNVVKKVNGQLIIISHTPFLGTDKLFAGWKEVYEQLIGTITA